jgi:hypothetical protein
MVGSFDGGSMAAAGKLAGARPSRLVARKDRTRSGTVRLSIWKAYSFSDLGFLA